MERRTGSVTVTTVRDASGVPVARGDERNIFASPLPDIVEDAPAPAVILRTGWIEPLPGDAAPGFATWSGPGRARWAQTLPMIEAFAARAGVEVWLWPHADHALSDVQGVRNAARAWPATSRCRVLVDPVGLLTGSMLEAAGEHVWRAVEAMVGEPRTAAILLAGVRPGRATADDGPSGARPVAVGAHEGIVPAREMGRIARAVVEAGVPLVLSAEGLAAQVAGLGLTGFVPVAAGMNRPGVPTLDA